MSDIEAEVTLVESKILNDLRARLNEFKKNVGIGEHSLDKIGGALYNDSAHSYWWYLEFGVATRFIGDAGSGLTKPAGIASEQGRPTNYPISRGNQTGTYQSGPNEGRQYRKRLRFKYQGKVVYRELVLHPGGRAANQGRGVLRIAIRQGQINLERKLRGFKSRKKVPRRNELVKVLNQVLVGILRDVRRYTPVDRESSNPTHLRDAWDIRKAR